MAETQSTAEAGGDSADAGQDDIGRGLVRRLLIEPLNVAGLKREYRPGKRGKDKRDCEVAEQMHAAAMELLMRDLDHMNSDNLLTLCDSVLRQATLPGPAQGHWPAAVMIIAWGHGLQARPFRLHRIVTSWLASREGPIAEAAGYEVQLLRFLRRHQRPPTQYDLTECKALAREDNRQMCLIADRIERGVVQDADREWHAAYLADQQLARSMVDRGIDARAAQAKGAAA
jgi:hypothetical protein